MPARLGSGGIGLVAELRIGRTCAYASPGPMRCPKDFNVIKTLTQAIEGGRRLCGRLAEKSIVTIAEAGMGVVVAGVIGIAVVLLGVALEFAGQCIHAAGPVIQFVLDWMADILHWLARGPGVVGDFYFRYFGVAALVVWFAVIRLIERPRMEKAASWCALGVGGAMQVLAWFSLGPSVSQLLIGLAGVLVATFVLLLVSLRSSDGAAP